MLLGLSNPAWLRSVLPVLSDALNEVGYPCELVALDASDNPAVGEVLAPWSQRSGFRKVVLPAQTTAAQLLTAGLRAARGDAVLLLSERGCAEIGLYPASTSRRHDFTRAIRSSLQECALEGNLGGGTSAESGMAALGAVARWAGDVTLLDRSEVDLLLSDR